MSKPEDIPQDVWDKALCFVEDAQYTPTEIVGVVARAIQAEQTSPDRLLLAMAEDAEFLIQRLNSFEDGINDIGVYRDYSGHVKAAVVRLWHHVEQVSNLERAPL